jgi:hypothetical protein
MTTMRHAAARQRRSLSFMADQRLARAPAGLLCLALALATTGCLQEQPTALTVNGNVTTVRIAAGGGGISGVCYVQNTVSFRPEGIMDLAMANHYAFFPEVQNRLPPTSQVIGGTPADLRPETSHIIVEGVDISLSIDTTTEGGPFFEQGGTFPTSAFEPTYMVIDAGGLEYGRFNIMPRFIGQFLQQIWADWDDDRKYTALQRVIVKATLVGHKADGTPIRSNEIEYPIDLCWGCLISVPDFGVGQDGGSELFYAPCTQLLVINPFLAPPCVMGNDEYVQCQLYCSQCRAQDIDPGIGAGAIGCDERFCPTN